MPTTHAGAEPAAAPSGGGSPAGRAGRNLPVAIAIGLVLGAMVLGSIYTYKPAFVGVVALFMLLGAWELVQALKVRLLHVPTRRWPPVDSRRCCSPTCAAARPWSSPPCSPPSR